MLDNSISAKARNIDIISTPGMEPSLIILDDGNGMTENELCEAMHYGSSNPLETRREDDLGRFGLGMKAASLSQCRKLIVVSKKEGKVSAYSWDLDYVIDSESWMLMGFAEEEMLQFPHIDQLLDKEHGTYIYLSEFDRIKEGTGNLSETFNKCMKYQNHRLAASFYDMVLVNRR